MWSALVRRVCQNFHFSQVCLARQNRYSHFQTMHWVLRGTTHSSKHNIQTCPRGHNARHVLEIYCLAKFELFGVGLPWALEIATSCPIISDTPLIRLIWTSARRIGQFLWMKSDFRWLPVASTYEDLTPTRRVQSKANPLFVMALLAIAAPRGKWNGIIGSISSWSESRMQELLCDGFACHQRDVTKETYVGMVESIIPAICTSDWSNAADTKSKLTKSRRRSRSRNDSLSPARRSADRKHRVRCEWFLKSLY